MSEKKQNLLEKLICCPKLIIRSKNDDNIELIATSSLIPNLKRQVQVIGLYISASWCSPCQTFTPKLAAFCDSLNSYREHQNDENENTIANLEKKTKLSIIFVSCDKSQQQYQEYYLTKMPASWLAIPYEERGCSRAILEEFNVQGIPTLILIDAKTGTLLSINGVDALNGDPSGAQFPWNHYKSPWYTNRILMAFLRQIPMLLIFLIYSWYHRSKASKSIYSQHTN